MPEFSLIIPVYNRPDELRDLLTSVAQQSHDDFEVIVVDDGSVLSSQSIVEDFKSLKNLRYLYKDNSGPGPSRNFGAEHATGSVLLFLDSDCTLPKGYLEAVHQFLRDHKVDLFGGPDTAGNGFNPMQKAVNYAMTSYLTTGGIRGQKIQLEKYKPRSFNMGVTQETFAALDGFKEMRYGEDIDFSLRAEKAGYRSSLVTEAFVYHRRRTNIKEFFKQVYHSGKARIHLTIIHPGTLKLVHIFPSIFTLGSIGLLISGLLSGSIYLVPLLLFCLLIFLHSSYINKSPLVGLISIVSSFTQLFGYGCGFLSGVIQSKFFQKIP